MKKDNKIVLGIVAAAAVLIARKGKKSGIQFPETIEMKDSVRPDKYKDLSGIGATKRPVRRIWNEVESAQRAGIDLSDPEGWKNNAPVLRRMSEGRLSASASAKPDEQRYFEQLRRAYRSVAGTNLPYDESVVRNENDDVILIYRDYHMSELPQRAAKYILTDYLNGRITDNYSVGYWATIGSIANGQKFVWGSKGAHRGVEMLVFGHSVPGERKQRISYLASPEKGGMYPEVFAHYVWESVTDGRGDDQEITNGVLDALRECVSVGQAQQMCKEEYLKAYEVKEPLLYQDVPF